MGIVLGSPDRSSCLGLTTRYFNVLVFHSSSLRRELAGSAREVWGSTRGTPKPCRWFMGFVERQVPRSYRTLVLGWTPLSQKPLPRPRSEKSNNTTLYTIESPLKQSVSVRLSLAPSKWQNHKHITTKQQQTTKTYVHLQTIGHASAGMSGMAGVHLWSRGAFTSRGAKPNGLEFDAHGLKPT